MDWDHRFDFVCVGSGAAGMAAAIRAHHLGLKPVILEASEKYGGSTAISGGVVWVPTNPQMGTRGISDNPDDARAYLKSITAGMVPPERIEAYVQHAPRMQRWFEANTHLHLDSLEQYSDYYPESPGGKIGGRSMEPVAFDASQLGKHFAELREPHRQSQILGKFGISAREAKLYLRPSFAGRLQLMFRMFQYATRWFTRRRFPRDTRLHAGNGLIGRLRLTLMELGTPLMLNTAVKELVMENGRVVGVIAEQGGRKLRIAGTYGVMLGAGGFERNQAMRDQYHPAPSRTEWNSGNPRNLGDGIRLGVSAGAAQTLMNEAWWTPVTRVPKSEQSWVLVVEKSCPGSLMVNAHGKRFTNEAAPYQDVVKGMYAGNAVPDCFLVFDAEYRRRYPVGPIAPGYAQPDSQVSKKFMEGFLIKAKTLEELAQKCGLDAAALRLTVDRYNQQCDVGVDDDFHRGESAIDRYYADDSVKPNPCLRALTHAPFYAIRVYPGDLGTKGGLVTDASARVLTEDQQPIPGLYAAGNTTASVMGPSYPGAGGTIGPALTFGMIAAETAKTDLSGG